MIFTKAFENTPIVRSLLRVIMASGISRASSVLRGLIVARILAPEFYGVSTMVGVILAYGQYADLGTSNAAFRDLASAIGRSDKEAVRRCEQRLLTLRMGSMVVVGLAAALFGLFGNVSSLVRLGLLAVAPIAFVSTLVATAILRWQAFGNVRDLSRTTSIMAILDLFFGVAFTLLWGLHGLLLAFVVAPSTALVLVLIRRGLMAPRVVSFAILKKYVWTGLPFLALALVDHNLIYIDHIIIMSFFTVRELGIYNIALLAAELIRIVGLALGIVIGPRVIREYASSSNKIECIRYLVLTPVSLLARIAPMMIIPLWFSAGYVIPRYYPRYLEAVLPLKILLIAFLFLVTNGGVTTFLFAIDKHRRNLLIAAPAVVFNILLDIALIKTGWGILGVAIGSLITYVVYSAVHLMYVVNHFNLRLRDWMIFFIEVFIPPVYVWTVMRVLDELLPTCSDSGAAVAAMTISFLLIMPMLIRVSALLSRLNEKKINAS